MVNKLRMIRAENDLWLSLGIFKTPEDIFFSLIALNSHEHPHFVSYLCAQTYVSSNTFQQNCY